MPSKTDPRWPMAGIEPLKALSRSLEQMASVGNKRTLACSSMLI